MLWYINFFVSDNVIFIVIAVVTVNVNAIVIVVIVFVIIIIIIVIFNFYCFFLRDKCGAAAVAGFMKTVAHLQPQVLGSSFYYFCPSDPESFFSPNKTNVRPDSPLFLLKQSVTRVQIFLNGFSGS